MLDYDEYIKKFNEMDYQSKKDKLINMLEVVKKDWNIYEQVWNLLKKVENIPESMIDKLGKLVIDWIYSADADKRENNQNEMKEVKNKLESMKQKEEKEQEKDHEEADRLLDKI